MIKNLFPYQRRKTREVFIGNLPMGASHPIRVQSMTTTDTMDTMGTVQQIIRLVEAGCEYVRITAPTVQDAENLKNIRAELERRKIFVPLIADIHFNPQAAMVAADFVHKVRVNPGNYADRKQFKIVEYTDSEYDAELARVREKFVPLIHKMKKNGVVLRIGANHGSLSDRILNRFGDTPKGMTMSALEFVEIAESEGFKDIVISMKSSIPKVMIEAYRELVFEMNKRGMDYPLHLGVTEAGEGVDGRIKSAIGIGTLLQEGLGDTIRVSLTEAPEQEIPVAFDILKKLDILEKENFTPITLQDFHALTVFGTLIFPSVGVWVSKEENLSSLEFKRSDKHWIQTKNSPDFLMIPEQNQTLADTLSPTMPKIPHLHSMDVDSFSDWEGLNAFPPQAPLVLKGKASSYAQRVKTFSAELKRRSKNNPLILWYQSECDKNLTTLFASMDLGGLLNDGIGNGIVLDAAALTPQEQYALCLNILQATRLRITKPDYISCPSCGRTLFDLETTSKKIREATKHLIGLKIGIMGCIVNGPGEMADADFGYVGAGPGKITLYKGKEVVSRNIPTEQAVDKLVELIKQNGAWVDPEP
jgi:(E)-4-hydroxy-3-methylbut-2-enyl-diphosphate synthase